MKVKDNCIKCGHNKSSNEMSLFCMPCKNKIISYCWNYNTKI